MKRIVIILAGVLFLAPLTLTGAAWATPPSGVTSSATLGRISLGPYHESSPSFKIFSNAPTDTVVLTTTIAPGGSTGWHSHPGQGQRGKEQDTGEDDGDAFHVRAVPSVVVS